MNVRTIIKRVIVAFAKMLPHNSIVFESIPDLSDNSKAVFDEMIRRGMNKKYKMIWLCKDNATYPTIENTKYISQIKCGGIKAFLYVAKAKCLISCNTFLIKNGDYQKSVYVMHGVGLKKAGTYTAPKGIDFITCLSEPLNRVIADEIHVDYSIMKVTGFPRNDALLNASPEKVKALFNNRYHKIIVWYPTFRQHTGGPSYSDSSITLPIIHNPQDAEELNQAAKACNVLIVLKPHFSQDLSLIKDGGYSNIKLITDEFFKINNLSSYEFVGGCDALVTDYSSIFFDYLLCNKPIASVWEDIEEYKRNRGFAFDVDYYMKGAVKIYNVSDFINFINEVALCKDSLAQERMEIMNIAHRFKDNKSTVRVVDFIEKVALNS